MSESSWQKRLRVVLIEPRNPLNIGAAARAMLNFGFEQMWLVDPWDRAFREAKSAMGAAGVLERARVTSDRAEALGDASLTVGTASLAGRSTDIVHRELPAAAAALRTHLQDRQAALVFGPEKYGLSREDLSFCDWILTIPTDPGCPSMNLGQAVAVICYELARRAKPVAALKTPATLAAGERERALELLLPLLEDSGFIFDANSAEKQTQKIRRWVGRLRLAPDDGHLLLAMLRQIRWKMDRIP